MTIVESGSPCGAITTLYKTRRKTITYDHTQAALFEGEKVIKRMTDAKHMVLERLLTHPNELQPSLWFYVDRFPDARILPLNQTSLENIKTDVVRPLISRLREDLRLGDKSLSKCIETVHGGGHVYTPHPSVQK